MIIGPRGTPYENGCFIFDIYLPGEYNNVAPLVSSMTTNGGKYRYNPNLYAEGVSHFDIYLSTTSPSIHIPFTHLPPYSRSPPPLITCPYSSCPLFTLPPTRVPLYPRSPLPTSSSIHLAHHHLALYLPSHVFTSPFMHLPFHVPPTSCTFPFMHLPLYQPALTPT
jgi:hypothetical protein